MDIRKQHGLGQKTLDELADWSASLQPDSKAAHAGKTEFLKRQTEFYERMATAAEKTAQDTNRYTRFMFWSVVVLAASSFVNLLLHIFR